MENEAKDKYTEELKQETEVNKRKIEEMAEQIQQVRGGKEGEGI